MHIFMYYLFCTFLLVSLVYSEDKDFKPPSVFTVEGRTYLDGKEEAILHKGQSLRVVDNKLCGVKKLIPLTSDEITELKIKEHEFEVQENKKLMQLQENLKQKEDELIATLNKEMDALKAKLQLEDDAQNERLKNRRI